MCTNFRPPTSRIVADMRGLEGLQPPAAGWPEEAFPGDLVPIILPPVPGSQGWPDRPDTGQAEQPRSRPDATQRGPSDGPPAQRCELARFGLVPRWCRDAAHAASLSRHTHNARSETVAERPSFRTPWRERRYALVPMLNYFEPCWESGRAERWRIARADGEPFAVAALHECWTDRHTGERVHTFSLLTVNADQHPLMRRMHRPGDEKRMLVIVPPAQYARWLQATPGEAEALLRQPPDVVLAGAPEPRVRPHLPRPAKPRAPARAAAPVASAGAVECMPERERPGVRDPGSTGRGHGASPPAQTAFDY